MLPGGERSNIVVDAGIVVVRAHGSVIVCINTDTALSRSLAKVAGLWADVRVENVCQADSH